MFVECKYSLNSKLQPCGFFADDCWVRCIIDVLHVNGERALALDHKTGKRKPASRQLKLSALLIFAHHPEVQLVKTGFFWLKTQERDVEEYRREQIPELWN